MKRFILFILLFVPFLANAQTKGSSLSTISDGRSAYFYVMQPSAAPSGFTSYRMTYDNLVQYLETEIVQNGDSMIALYDSIGVMRALIVASEDSSWVVATADTLKAKFIKSSVTDLILDADSSGTIYISGDYPDVTTYIKVNGVAGSISALAGQVEFGLRSSISASKDVLQLENGYSTKKSRLELDSTTILIDFPVGSGEGSLLYASDQSAYFVPLSVPHLAAVQSEIVSYHDSLNGIYETAGRSIYIETTGNDLTGDGTSTGTAFLTINRALQDVKTVVPGSLIKIIMGDGTFVADDSTDILTGQILGIGHARIRFQGEMGTFESGLSLSTSGDGYYTNGASSWTTDELIGKVLSTGSPQSVAYPIESNTGTTLFTFTGADAMTQIDTFSTVIDYQGSNHMRLSNFENELEYRLIKFEVPEFLNFYVRWGKLKTCWIDLDESAGKGLQLKGEDILIQNTVVTTNMTAGTTTAMSSDVGGVTQFNKVLFLNTGTAETGMGMVFNKGESILEVLVSNFDNAFSVRNNSRLAGDNENSFKDLNSVFNYPTPTSLSQRYRVNYSLNGLMTLTDVNHFADNLEIGGSTYTVDSIQGSFSTGIWDVTGTNDSIYLDIEQGYTMYLPGITPDYGSYSEDGTTYINDLKGQGAATIAGTDSVYFMDSDGTLKTTLASNFLGGTVQDLMSVDTLRANLDAQITVDVDLVTTTGKDITVAGKVDTDTLTNSGNIRLMSVSGNVILDADGGELDISSGGTSLTTSSNSTIMSSASSSTVSAASGNVNLTATAGDVNITAGDDFKVTVTDTAHVTADSTMFYGKVKMATNLHVDTVFSNAIVSFAYNVAFAEMGIQDNVTATTINTVNVWEEISVLEQQDTFNMGVEGSVMVIPSTGVYFFTYSVSSSAASANKNFEFAISIDDVIDDESRKERRFSNTDVGNLGDTGYISVMEGDSVKFEVRNITDNTNTTLESATVTFEKRH